MEELRLLLGLNLPSQPTFALVLIGDEYLMGSLQLRPHRALYSRLSAQCQLQPWTPSEVAQYLHKKDGEVNDTWEKRVLMQFSKMP